MAEKTCKMTRSHFDWMAQEFGLILRKMDQDPESYRRYSEGVFYTIGAFTAAMKSTNVAFDTVRFETAMGKVRKGGLR